MDDLQHMKGPKSVTDTDTHLVQSQKRREWHTRHFLCICFPFQAERECGVFQQSRDSIQHLTSHKSRIPPWPQEELSTCSPNARWVKAQELKAASSEDPDQYRHQVTSVMEQKQMCVFYINALDLHSIIDSPRIFFLIQFAFHFKSLSLDFQLSRIMKQVRHRLAACQTVQESEDFSELPGGIWKVSPTRNVSLFITACDIFPCMWC